MRLSVTVDEKLLDEARKVTKARTKREVIELGLKELLRRKRLEGVMQHGGKIDLALSVKDLLRLRETG